MKEKPLVNGSRSALVFYILLTVVFLAFAAGIYLLDSYFPLEYEETVLKYSEEYGVDPALICGVIATESRFDADAKSEKGAMGLMQIMPETGEWIAGKIGIKDFSEEMLTEPAVNIEMGTWYLTYLADRFDREADTVIAAYNAGHGNVEKWLKDAQYSDDGRTLSEIPFDETRNYVKKVNRAYEIYRKIRKVH
ncbi:MAG: lytic transglycosylase domain-containing protein [Christensenellaceae bacterium]|nr:lytic transglycosylase domain-containing protein [Christensenellaceae bacterium]